MSNGQPSALVRHKEMTWKRKRLEQHPTLKMEAIAAFILTLQYSAMHLRKFIEFSREMELNQQSLEAMKYLYESIEEQAEKLLGKRIFEKQEPNKQNVSEPEVSHVAPCDD